MGFYAASGLGELIPCSKNKMKTGCLYISLLFRRVDERPPWVSLSVIRESGEVEDMECPRFLVLLSRPNGRSLHYLMDEVLRRKTSYSRGRARPD